MSEFRSELFAFAHRYVDESSRRSPMAATRRGITDYDDRLDDFSPDGLADEELLIRSTLSGLEPIQPGDELDRIGKAVMRERLEASLRLVESGERSRTFSILRSPASSIRNVFEMQRAETPEEAEKVRFRLADVRRALAGWRQTLDRDSARGLVAARRQCIGVARQLDTYARGAFTGIARRVAVSSGVDVEGSGLVAAGADAERTSGELAEWMRDVYAPRAAPDDPVGAERYAPWAAFYNGADLDVAELYEWGWEELKRINDRMWEIGAELAPHAKRLHDVAEALDGDERRIVHGTDALLQRLRALTDGAIEMLAGVHFDIDERVRVCEARLAPEGSMAAPYYTGPSEDLSRPGITWYPTLGHTSFPMWKNVSTWYHESVPGHHLQVSTSLLERDRQTRFQRLEGFVSGYGEGWALYAERLMQELGALDDLGNELGYLSKQAMRAARVVVDIGMHLSLPAPKDIGPLGPLEDAAGRVWDAEMAVSLLEERALVANDRAVSEVDRYLGTPGQAIAYKVGERVWLECREDARRRLGRSFDLKAWHAYGLGLGPMGLDPLRLEMQRFSG
jgi:uncharacterized protein (DUF885 family)